MTKLRQARVGCGLWEALQRAVDLTLLTSPPLITKRIPVSAAATSTVVAPGVATVVAPQI